MSPEPSSAFSAVEQTTLKLKFVGGNATSRLTGLDRLVTSSNYFIGNNPKLWRTDIANFKRLQYTQLYDGIDAIFYGQQHNIEYDFLLAPHADAKLIRLAFDGARQLHIDPQGDLLIDTEAGQLRQPKPVAYQERNGTRTEIACHYKLGASTAATVTDSGAQVAGARERGRAATADDRVVGFVVGEYDKNLPLVIDPIIDFSTFLGGTESFVGFEATDVALDADENIYIAGHTFLVPIAAPSAAQAQTMSQRPAPFVAKIDAVNKQLVYLTYLSDTGATFSTQVSTGIVVDSAGCAYITGYTTSPNFPTTPGAFQTTLLGSTNGFIAKLDAHGSALLYSTYVGAADTTNSITPPQCLPQFGGCSTRTADIAIDAAGNAYVTGDTNARSFPTTAQAFKPTKSTDDCRTTSDSSNFIRPCQEAFITKLNATGTGLVYSTFLGGNGNDSGAGIKVDSEGNAYVTGSTQARDFPTKEALNANFLGGDSDLFLSKLNAAGSALLHSTYLGGRGSDKGNDLDLDAAGNVYICGETNSPDLPVSAGVLQNRPGNFLIYKTTDGGATWKPLVKGLPGNLIIAEIAVDPANSANLVAGTDSGVYQSTDGGESWRASADKQLPLFDFQSFAPQNPAVAFASYYDSNRDGYILLRSTDKGSTWNEIAYPALDGGIVQVNDVKVDPTNLSTFYLTNTFYDRLSVSDVRILKTTDAGATWRYIDEGLPAQAPPGLLGIHPQNPALLFASTGALFRSKNGGVKWKATNLTDANPSLISFNPANPSVVYAAGSRLFGSTDNGASWNAIDANLSGFAQLRVASNRLYAVSAGNVFRSSDGGRNWADIGSSHGLANVRALAADPNSPATLYAGTQLVGGDGFAMKLNPQASSISYCTYLGGANFDSVASIAVDGFGNASLTGQTSSADFPTRDAIQTKPIYSDSAFVTKLNASGGALYSTFLSSNGSMKGAGIATDKRGSVYVVGPISGDQLPQISPLQASASGSPRAFITRITDAPQVLPAPVVLSVTPDSGAGLDRTRVTIKGANFLPGATVSAGLLTEATVVVDANTIQTTIPGGAEGRATIAVMNPDGQTGTLPQAFDFLQTPLITAVDVADQQLRVFSFSLFSYGFDSGAVLLINGKEVKPDPPVSEELLKSRRALKKIGVGELVQLQVRNGNGLLSNRFSFRRVF